MLRAYLRAAVAFFALLAICIVLQTGPWVFAIASVVVVDLLLLWLPRAEAREMVAAARQRRQQRRGGDSSK